MDIENKDDDVEIEHLMDEMLKHVSKDKQKTKSKDKVSIKDTMGDILDQLNGDQLINYQDQVLEYLKKQEEYNGEDMDIQDLFTREDPHLISENAAQILRQLLTDVDNITAFKEAYAQKKIEKNQFELFDLSTVMKDFYLSERVMESLAFRENLLISRVDNEGRADPVGGLCIDVQVALGSKWARPKTFPDFTKTLINELEDIKQEQPDTTANIEDDLEEYTQFLEEEMRKEYKKFNVYISSQFEVNGENAGSRTTSWVDRNLHTLDEKRVEYISSKNEINKCHLCQKQLYIFMGKKHYDVRVDPGQDYCQKFCYSFRRAKDFVGEAANFLLMRYLAMVKFIGEFEMSALYIDGALCRNIYQCDGPMGGYINNQRMDLYKVRRTIVEECGIVQRSCTLLSTDGRIMKHDWQNCDYVLQINPLISPTKKKATLVLHFSEAWKYDLHLLSKYLDKKTSTTLHMKNYLHDHNEIENLIKDFVQNILQIKPENIVEFTKHFFLSYAPYLIPRAEYFEQDVNNCFTSQH